MRAKPRSFLHALFLLAVPCACSSSDEAEAPSTGLSDAAAVVCDGDEAGVNRPATWSKSSHCPKEAAGYDIVFNEDKLHRIDIEVAAADYQSSLDDLDENYSGSTGTADLDSLPNPIWVPVTVKFNDKTWTQVGMRWKGHASLKGAWQRGIRKLSFNLSFDKYESAHPELADQRFYGFKKLSFSNGYNDPSLIRERTASSVFRSAGVPAARSSFAPVYINYGKGAVYFGLYTIVEDPADRMLEEQVGKSGGNLYKPWGEAARWLSLSDIGASDVQTYFEKETNESKADWSDILAAITALHADRTNNATWREGLEKTFDVEAFLKALATNQVMANWDSYGCMHHNYLVYANPKRDGRLLWMPWDLNESLRMVEQAGCVAPGSVMLDEIVKGESSTLDTNWPLIKLVLGEASYRDTYLNQLRVVLDSAFGEAKLLDQMQADHALIAPYVVGPTETEVYPYTNTTKADFEESLTGEQDGLIAHVKARREAVAAVLAANGK